MSAESRRPPARLESRRPRRGRPVGTQNLGTLLRNPWDELNQRVIDGLHDRGFDDLRLAHGPIMQFVDDRGTRVTELARRTALTKATVVYLVNDLEELGYLERVSDPDDGRARLVRPTKRGLRSVNCARRVIEELTADWADLIGEEELAELRRLLVRLNEALWPS